MLPVLYTLHKRLLFLETRNKNIVHGLRKREEGEKLTLPEQTQVALESMTASFGWDSKTCNEPPLNTRPLPTLRRWLAQLHIMLPFWTRNLPLFLTFMNDQPFPEKQFQLQNETVRVINRRHCYLTFEVKDKGILSISYLLTENNMVNFNIMLALEEFRCTFQGTVLDVEAEGLFYNVPRAVLESIDRTPIRWLV